MIINLRGTSGSGKSTIVKTVMSHLNMVPQFCEKRIRPIGYLGKSVINYGDHLWVVGHYEIECGGADTIASLDTIYDQVSCAADKGYDVLYEGIMAGGEYRRCAHLSTQHKIQVIALNTPMDVCIAAIMDRRERRGNTKPFDASRTLRRDKEVKSMMEYLKNRGVPTMWMNREQALDYCLSTFHLK